jgi:hypothetical protein
MSLSELKHPLTVRVSTMEQRGNGTRGLDAKFNG